MAVKALSPSSVKRYVLKRDPARGPNGEAVEGSTVFILKTLDGHEIAALRDNQYVIDPAAVEAAKTDDKVKPVTFKISPYAQAFEACRIGLIGWENFQDATGAIVDFKTENAVVAGKASIVATHDTLSRLDAQDAFELMNEIVQVNQVSPAEEKK